MLTHRVRQRNQVPGVDTDGAELAAADVDRRAHGLFNIEGIDEHGRIRTQRFDLSSERVTFGVVEQRERVRAGAGGRDLVPDARHQIRRRREAGNVRRARGGDRKSTRLNSSHVAISYAVFCLKKKKIMHERSATSRYCSEAL